MLTRGTLTDNFALVKTITKAKTNDKAKSKFKPKGKATGPRYLLSSATFCPAPNFCTYEVLRDPFITLESKV